MIVFLKDKSIFDSHAEAITNTVNCVGVMGKGIAAEYKARFPQMFADYKRRCEIKNIKPGQPYIWEDEDCLILNFPSKDHWKGNSKLEWIEEGLIWIKDNYQGIGISSLSMPPIGCGNGGLNWTDVKALIEKHLGSLDDLLVSVYLPTKAMNAPSEKTSSKESQIFNQRKTIAAADTNP